MKGRQKMKVENIVVAVGDLVHCPWNPRGEITAESVAELSASIRAKGMLQDIGLMRIPAGAEGAGKYWIIYGNRRAVAAQGAGLTEVSAKLYDGVSEADAREITRIENEVRLGVDPLRDAELLHSFIAAGRTYEDVATIFGTSAATVCRREKLVDLSKKVRKVVADHPGMVATGALEQMACYPGEVQDRLASYVASCAKRGRVSWNDLRWKFHAETRNLDEAAFIRAGHGLKCVGCTRRTGCQQNLFGELEGDGKLGRCLDVACFGRTVDEYISEEISQRVPDGVERVNADYAWQVSGDAFGDKRSKTRPAAWVVVNKYEGTVLVKWGPSKVAMDEVKAEEARLREDERQAKSRELELKGSARRKICAAIKDEDGASFVKIVGDYFGDRRDAENDLGKFLCAVLVCRINSTDIGKPAALVKAVVADPAGTFCGTFADEIGDSVDDDWSFSLTRDIVRLFPGADCLLTEDEKEAIGV